MPGRKRRPDNKPPKGLYVINVQYLCGSEVGFATADADKAAMMAAKIMTDICPQCKLKAGMPITEEEKEMLLIEGLHNMTHEEAQRN